MKDNTLLVETTNEKPLRTENILLKDVKKI